MQEQSEAIGASLPMRDVAVLGAGNGGKAVAADLSLMGARVRLFEWPEYAANIEGLLSDPVIETCGVVSGQARLAAVTTNLAEAIDGAELIVACVQGLAHARLANELAPLVQDGALVMLNPGSTGGSLEMRRIFCEHKIDKYVVLAETGTLTHCSRAHGPRSVDISLRVRHIAFAALPGVATRSLMTSLPTLFPGLQARLDVLEVALCNGNPVIHPAIMLGNAEQIMARGPEHRFYAEGVTPEVAATIEAVDRERIALGETIGYELMTEPEMCVAQGYAESTDYLECYSQSPVFSELASPATMEHRYLHEDCGLGLVTYVSLGEHLGVPTPVSRDLIARAQAITGRDYLADGRRTAENLGLTGHTPDGFMEFLQMGVRLGSYMRPGPRVPEPPVRGDRS